LRGDGSVVSRETLRSGSAGEIGTLVHSTVVRTRFLIRLSSITETCDVRSLTMDECANIRARIFGMDATAGGNPCQSDALKRGENFEACLVFRTTFEA
jgi:hypothetical protein